MSAAAAARVVAVCVGRAEPIGPARRASADGAAPDQARSAIRKQPVSTLQAPVPVEVAETGLWGDEQADLRVHGGPDKAVYAYPSEHYAFWETVRAQAKVPGALAPGALGENLLIEGLHETGLWIGDVLRIGQARLRVTAPRTPCWKLDAVMGFGWASKMMLQSGFTGFYLAVVCQGAVAAGDEIVVMPGERVLSVAQRHAMHHRTRQQSLF